MSVKVSKMGMKKEWSSGLGDGYVGKRIWGCPCAWDLEDGLVGCHGRTGINMDTCMVSHTAKAQIHDLLQLL